MLLAMNHLQSIVADLDRWITREKKIRGLQGLLRRRGIRDTQKLRNQLADLAKR